MNLIIATFFLVFNTAFGALSESDLLNDQVVHLKRLLPKVLRINKARVSYLIEANERVLQSLDEKGPGHMETVNQFISYFIRYKYSASLFGRIGSPATENSIEIILADYEALKRTRGFDDIPYITVVANQFERLLIEIKEVLRLDQIDDQLRSELQKMVPKTARALAIAKNGDQQEETLRAGKNLYLDFKMIYPLFDQYFASDETFDRIMKIQGVLEFYREYANLMISTGSAGSKGEML